MATTSTCPICGRKGNKHNPGCAYPKTMAGQAHEFAEALRDLGRVVVDEFANLLVRLRLLKRKRRD